MSNLVNPTFDIPGYANIRGTEAVPGELRVLDHPVMAACILDLDAPTAIGQQYRLAGTISDLTGTIGNTPRITFVTAGVACHCEESGEFEFIYTAEGEQDFIMPRSSSRTVATIRNLSHELHEA